MVKLRYSRTLNNEQAKNFHRGATLINFPINILFDLPSKGIIPKFHSPCECELALRTSAAFSPVEESLRGAALPGPFVAEVLIEGLEGRVVTPGRRRCIADIWEEVDICRSSCSWADPCFFVERIVAIALTPFGELERI